MSRLALIGLRTVALPALAGAQPRERTFTLAASQPASEARHALVVGLFYFAGHGMQVKGRNLLVPTRKRGQDPFLRHFA
jgi:uncharacterized caspase-like protein